jgi:putative ABC transport system substrate-binding protein
VLANRANPVTVPILRANEAAARQIGMKLRVLDVREPARLEAAFETMRREHTDAIVLVADPLRFSQRPLIVQLAAHHRLPAVYETRLFPEAGGLLSYGPLSPGAVRTDGAVRGPHSERGEARRPPRGAADEVRAGINLKTAKASG